MQIYFTENFKKKFNKLPGKIQDKFEKRLDMFIKTPSHPFLKVHPLRGNLIGYRAFSVTGDYRVVYKLIDKNSAKFISIGTHAQAYE